MKCPLCDGGNLKRRKVEVEKYGTPVGLFAAEVCSGCGEQIFSSKEAAKIEAAIKKLGLWGVPVPSRVYKVGGNFVISLKKKVAESLGITSPREVILVPQVNRNRLVVEVP
ncbi:YgiT-type zinc finger protein [Candidatus Micrarchaeota archaeon]|nr:YgiT-type zinc finger protein [Candidatus Micrarchaeota archaeon]